MILPFLDCTSWYHGGLAFLIVSVAVSMCFFLLESFLVCQGLRDLEAHVNGIERRQGFKELVLSRPRFLFALFVNSHCQSHSHQSPPFIPPSSKLSFDFVCNFRQLLHMRSSPYLESLTERQLASLLYRDHVGLKHSSRDRLVKELSDCKNKETDQVATKNRGVIRDVSEDHANDPLLKALLDHVWEAH